MNPLVVDLDGTFIKADLLHETANTYITRHPLQSPRLIGWLAKDGISGLKTHLAEETDLKVGSIPRHEALGAWLQEQKAQGRTLVLATASHKLLAEALALECGIFDEVLATDASTNLKAGKKRDLLIQRFGQGGFDYVGNDWADVPVFQAARRSYLVSHSDALITKVRSLGNLERVFAPDRPALAKSAFKALRVHQWVKNTLLFLPVLAAHRFRDGSSLLQVLLAFLVFGMTASSVYILNDLVDVADDRHHPSKRNRPFAAGNLSLVFGWVAWPVAVLTAFGLASWLLPWSFLAVLVFYFLLTLAYSLLLKRIAVVDVLTLAGLYTLRILAGGAAARTAPSFWLLVFSMFIFLSLALIKRFSELRLARSTGHNGELHGRGYVHTDLEMVSSMGVTAGYLAVLVLAFYIQDPHTALLYRSPKLIWFACPLLLLWISRAWLIAHRGEMNDDPIVFALKDPMSWLIFACLVVDLLLARVVL